MAARLILPDALPKFGIDYSERHRRRLEKAGLFPRRVRLNRRSHGYVEPEIEEYVATKIAERDLACD